MAPGSANDIVESQLDTHLAELEHDFTADVLAFLGPITYGVDDAIRDAVEARGSRPTLFVILETTGGYIEVAQRIADTLRKHYQRVEFVIPNFAMSAGTVLVMSGDAIHMDYYSVLGPIDPQVQRPTGGGWIPALGYLVQYERLIERSRKGKLSTAEMTFLIEKFDPAELYRYEQERELSISLLKEWLVKYKFKNWKKTEARKLPVTKAMRTKRATAVAKSLNDTEKWHSHGRGISMEVLQRDLRLRIEDFGRNKELSGRIRTYHKLLVDYIVRRGHDYSGVLHTKGLYVPLVPR